MKKVLFMGLLGTAMAAGFTSCSNDEDVVVNDALKALEVEVGINNLASQSRAGITGESFVGSESVGLYLYKGTTATAIEDEANRDYNSALANATNILVPKNICYQRQTADGSWKAENDKPIILSNVDGVVYSYYPYASTNINNDGRTIPVSVATTQGTGQSDGTADANDQIDYMWGNPVTGVSNSTDGVTLQMNHALAMLSFKFVRDTYPGEGIVNSIELKNASGKSVVITGSATMNIKDGSITHVAQPNTAASISITPAAETLANDNDTSIDETKTPRMLVYPMTVETFDNGDALFVITLDGKPFTLNVPGDRTDAYKWKAGNNYLYTFKLIGHELVVEDVKITKWTEKEMDMGSNGDMTSPDA